MDELYTELYANDQSVSQVGAAHTLDRSTWEAEAGGPLGLRPI